MKPNKDLSERDFTISLNIKKALHCMNMEKPLLAKDFLYDALRVIHN